MTQNEVITAEASAMKEQLLTLIKGEGVRLVFLVDDFNKAFCYWNMGASEAYTNTKDKVSVIYFRATENAESKPDSFDYSELHDFLYNNPVNHSDRIYFIPLCFNRDNNATLRQLLRDTYFLKVETRLSYWFKMENSHRFIYEDTEPAQDTLNRYVSEYIKLFEYATPQRLQSGEEAIDSFLHTILTTQMYKPLKTNYKSLDRLIGGGFYAGTLVVIASAPAMGKTALAQQLFEQVAETQKRAVLYINLEMTRDQLIARSISRRSKATKHPLTMLQVLQSYDRSMDELYTIDEITRAYKANVAPYMMYNPTDTGAILENIVKTIELSAETNIANGEEAPLVVIDYLQLVTANDRSDAIESAQKTILALKDYARKYNTTVCVISAQNREANKAGTADLTSGLNGSSIEYTADLYLTLNLRVLEEPTAEELTQAGNDKKILVKNAMLAPIREMKLTVEKSRFSRPKESIDVSFIGENASYYFEGEFRPTTAEEQKIFEDTKAVEEAEADEIYKAMKASQTPPNRK